MRWYARGIEPRLDADALTRMVAATLATRAAG